MNNYTLLSIKCPLPDKLSAANVLPDTPPPKKKLTLQTMVEWAGTHIKSTA